MKLSNTRMPLVVALSAALALAAGCNRDVDTRTGVETAPEPVEQPAEQPVDPAPVVTQGDAASADGAQVPDMNNDGRTSDQPVDDTWITTKVKSSLLADPDVSGLKIDVDTANGVVSLSGQVDQQAQIEEATRIAREIEGVTDVQTTKLVTRTK